MQRTNKELIGITTTVPVETVFAAGAVPVDLNNLGSRLRKHSAS